MYSSLSFTSYVFGEFHYGHSHDSHVSQQILFYLFNMMIIITRKTEAQEIIQTHLYRKLRPYISGLSIDTVCEDISAWDVLSLFILMLCWIWIYFKGKKRNGKVGESFVMVRSRGGGMWISDISPPQEYEIKILLKSFSNFFL